jgi:hypothetical protein
MSPVLGKTFVVFLCNGKKTSYNSFLFEFDLISDVFLLRFVYIDNAGHLMEKIEGENLLHRAFSVFLFNSKYELLLQVGTWFYPSQTSFRICMQLLQSGSSTPNVHHLPVVIINQSTLHQMVWFLKVNLQHFYRPEHGLLILLTLLGYSYSSRRVLYLYD